MKIHLLLFVLLTSMLNACFVPDVIQQERALFRSNIANNPSLQARSLALSGDHLFYVAAGEASKPALIIIHGTPGSWNQYARYMLDEALLQRFQVLVVDRPGWGHSTLGDQREIASFAEQATLIAALSEQIKANNNNQPVILMGHSLGASIAPKVAMDYPRSVDGLLLFAGTLDPELAKPRWFNYAGKVQLVDWFLGGAMKKANQEIFALKAELQAMKPQWGQVQQPTLVVQGLKDTLVYPANSQFARTHLNHTNTQVIELPEDGHLFPITRRREVALWAECLLLRVQEQGSGTGHDCSLAIQTQISNI